MKFTILKRCSNKNHRVLLPLTDFWKDKSKRDGLNHRCKQCAKIYNLKYYLKRKYYYYRKDSLKIKNYRENFRQSNPRLYYTLSSYYHIIQRCTNPKHDAYRWYGGRGIKICDRWKKSSKFFIEDMGLKPEKGWCIDRINVNGNYELNNCRWVNPIDSLKNKRHKDAN